MTSILTHNAANTARTKPTTGDTKQSFVNTNHLGWLLCDGKGYDKIAYALLYKVIGDAFLPAGGDRNESNFYVPDMRGHVIGNKGIIIETCNGVRTEHDFYSGYKTGEVNHQLTILEMPAHNHNSTIGSPGVNTFSTGITSENGLHNHSINDPKHSHDYSRVSGTFPTYTASPGNRDPFDGTTGDTTALQSTGITILNNGLHTHQIASNGNNQCHNNMQPTIFYGNTFIYSGVPIIGAPNVPTTFPFNLPPSNPLLI